MAGKEKEKAVNVPEGAAAENAVETQSVGFDFASEVLKAFGVTIEEATKCISEYGKLLEENESLKKKLEGDQDSKTLRAVNKEGEVRIKFVLSPAGRYFLPYNVGQKVFLQANQADELVEAKYAEYVR